MKTALFITVKKSAFDKEPVLKRLIRLKDYQFRRDQLAQGVTLTNSMVQVSDKHEDYFVKNLVAIVIQYDYLTTK